MLLWKWRLTGGTEHLTKFGSLETTLLELYKGIDSKNNPTIDIKKKIAIQELSLVVIE